MAVVWAQPSWLTKPAGKSDDLDLRDPRQGCRRQTRARSKVRGQNAKYQARELKDVIDASTTRHCVALGSDEFIRQINNNFLEMQNGMLCP